MKNSFTISKIPKLNFGPGSINRLGKLCSPYGNTTLLVTGKKSFNLFASRKKIEEQLTGLGKWFKYEIHGEPTPEDIDQAVNLYRSKSIDVLVAIGGGSVLDAGKAIAAMLMENGSISEYLEGVGTEVPSGDRIPLILVPTTSGTGSEATKNAVITKTGIDGFKKSLRHENYVPDVALIDPELSLSCSKNQTIFSGMDAFTQLLEAYLSNTANAFSDALAYFGLESIVRSLEKVVANGNNLEARSDMSYAAYLSGICLANAGLGVIHGFAQPLGSIFSVPHGIVCGGLMGSANQITLMKSIEQGDETSTILAKYAKVGKLFFPERTGDMAFFANKLIDKINKLVLDFNIPKFSKFNISTNNIEEILQQTSLKNHPIKLDKSDLRQILLERL